MGIRDEDLEGGLFEAFRAPEPTGGSVLGTIQRLHGAGSSILLRDADDEDASPVLIRRDDQGSPADDDRYVVLGEIARGGIGVVYKGRDKDLNRDIALKVLRKEYAEREDVIQRFIEEAQVGGQLQHPGIVPIYGIGLHKDGRPSFAMKLIKGRTLAELLDSNPRGVDLLAVYEQIAQTMAYAHSRGVIHRDLKPANVMVGAFGEVQVVDWGFAKVLGQAEPERAPDRTVIATVRSGPVGSQSIVGSVMGTPAYMPPEQAMGSIEDLDERCDVFALGAILCEIFTGKAPYTGEPKDQLIAAFQCRLEPAFERLDAAEAAVELKQLVRDCLEPLMADRPENARVVAQRLSDHLANVEERARQAELDALTSETEATREQQARKRVLGLAAAALLLVTVGGGGYFFWKSDRDAREARAAPLIAAALREATGFEGKQDWPAAVSAAQRAVDTATSEGVEGPQARSMLARLQGESERAEEAVRLRAEDDAFLAALEDIRGRRGGLAASADALPGEGTAETALLSTGQDDAGTDAAYTAAFEQRFGSLAQGVEALAASPNAEAYAANLGFWCWIRRIKLKADHWQAIDRAARRIAPAHEHVRDALLSDDAEALLAVAKHGAAELPLALAAQVGLALSERPGQAHAAVAFLERQHLRAPGDFWINMRLAYAASKSKDWDRALRYYTAALAVQPMNASAWRSLGLALGNKGDLDGAIRSYENAITLYPKSAFAHNNLGIALRDRRDWDGAIEAYQRAIALDPQYPQPLVNLGALLCDRLGRYDEALTRFRAAIALDILLGPELAKVHHNVGIALRRKRDWDGALEALKKAVALDPEEAGFHRLVGATLNRKGDLEGAIQSYEKAIALDPNQLGARINLGALLANRLRRFDEAITVFLEAIALYPSSSMAHKNLSVVLARKRDPDAAIQAFKKAVALAPSYARAHVSLGDALVKKGDVDGAIRSHERAIALDPKSAYAHGSLGNALLRKGDLDGAIRSYEQAIALDPKSAIAHGNLGAALAKKGDLDGAIRSCEQAIALDPKRAGAHSNLGQALANRGDLDGAIRSYEQAIALNPKSATAHSNLGAALGEKGDLDGAIRSYEQALALNPKSATAHSNLGAALGEKGDVDAAIRSFEQAIALDPKNARSQEGLRLARLSKRLPGVIAGDDQPADWREALDFAELATGRKDAPSYALALRLYREAFEANPSSAEDLGAGHRYNAACAASLAGEASHRQALEWLRADLALRREQLATNRVEVARALSHWKRDSDLASIRDAKDLPDDFKQLWADVDALLKRAQEQVK